jgi:hypothetical protein
MSKNKKVSDALWKAKQSAESFVSPRISGATSSPRDALAAFNHLITAIEALAEEVDRIAEASGTKLPVE